MTTAIERVVRRGDVALAVTEAGERDRPPVLLVHGYSDTRALWTGVVARLATDHRVITYDMRGAGSSTRPRGDEAYDLRHLADDMAAVLDATSPDRPVHVVGHDWGSIAAWELCTTARADHRVASLTSISGPCLDHAGRWMWQRLKSGSPAALLGVAEQAIRSWYMTGLVVPCVAARVWRQLGPRWPEMLQRFEATLCERSPTQAADGIAGAALYRRNMHARITRPRGAPHARVPVQLIVPRNDHFISSSLAGEAARWTSSLLVRHVDAGHWVPRTHPDQVADWIGEHVATVERAPEVGRARIPEVGCAPDRSRVVLVTGAGRGVGRAAALAFAGEGATVIAVDLDGAAAEQTAALCGLVGPRATATAVEVSDAAAVTTLVAQIGERHGALDVLVNHAGATPLAMHACRMFGLQMAEAGSGGHIVNIAAVAAASPASARVREELATRMLSACLCAELGEHGIEVRSVCAGAEDDASLDAAEAALGDAIVDSVRGGRAALARVPDAPAGLLSRMSFRARRWLGAPVPGAPVPGAPAPDAPAPGALVPGAPVPVTNESRESAP